MRDLQSIIDEQKVRVVNGQSYISKLESQVTEQKMEIELMRRRAEQAEDQMIKLREANYQLEVQQKEVQNLLDESNKRIRDLQDKYYQEIKSNTEYGLKLPSYR